MISCSSDYGIDFFRQFDLVMNALDNRGWFSWGCSLLDNWCTHEQGKQSPPTTTTWPESNFPPQFDICQEQPCQSLYCPWEFSQFLLCLLLGQPGIELGISFYSTAGLVDLKFYQPAESFTGPNRSDTNFKLKYRTEFLTLGAYGYAHS